MSRSRKDSFPDRLGIEFYEGEKFFRLGLFLFELPVLVFRVFLNDRKCALFFLCWRGVAEKLSLF